MSDYDLIASGAAVVLSASPDGRNYLRELLSKVGLKSVCFENEAICFDNLKSIQPQLVVTETDRAEVVWRFIFALHASRVEVPFVVISESLREDGFSLDGLQLSVYTMRMSRLSLGLLEDLVAGAEKGQNGSTSSRPRRSELLVGQTKDIQQIRMAMPRITASRDAVIINGEPGTGKELLARALVAKSPVKETFIKIDCRKLWPELLSNGWFSAIFGNDSSVLPATIFLDHIDQLSASAQAEMLSILEAAENFQGEGNAENRNAIRFIAASTQPVDSFAGNGSFRKDLFYRLNVIPVLIPPLRERREDISLLMDYFIIDACTGMGKSVLVPSPEIREMMYLYPWPGNVKELQNLMRRVADSGSEACIYANNHVQELKTDSRDYLFRGIGEAQLPSTTEIRRFLPVIQNMSLKRICDEFASKTEKKLMKKALEATQWNRKKAAQLLNISYKSMLNKMKAYDI